MSLEISLEIRRFIDQHVESVAQLEVLLLLKQHPERDWTADDMAKALYAAPEMCAGLLQEWARRGFAVAMAPGPKYRYRESPELDQLVVQLAELYRERRVSVITLIYAKPVDRVRTFADAFRLRGTDS